jgi:two-component system, NarL family, response regulator DegU
MMVLIVDDHVEMRRLISRVIGDLADDIRECSDGAQALAAYRAARPDLVLLDIEMKELDGLKVTRDIVAAHPEARIVVVTRHDDLVMREAARHAGACGVVLKENLYALRTVMAPACAG